MRVAGPAASQPSQAAAEASATPAFDYPYVVRLFGGEEGFARQNLSKFESFATLQMDKIRAALRAGDAETTAREAHSFKGSCGYAGAHALKAAAEAVVLGARQVVASHGGGAQVHYTTPTERVEQLARVCDTAALQREFDRLIPELRAFLESRDT